MTPRIFYTLGHSNRSIEELVRILARAQIGRLADIRRYPGSRRNPQFAREALEVALRQNRIEYEHFPELGGHRAPIVGSLNQAWREDGLRGYADHLSTEEFARGLNRLFRWVGSTPTALMCAEVDPQNCHRQILADALLVSGHRVIHLLGPTSSREHERTPSASLRHRRLVYDGGNESIEFPPGA